MSYYSPLTLTFSGDLEMTKPLVYDRLKNSRIGVKLSSNRLSIVQARGFPHNYEDLRLCFDELAKNPDLIAEIHELNLMSTQDSKITVLPKSVGGLSCLTCLDISSNCLTVLPKSIGNLTLLTTLDVRYNGLIKLPPAVGNLVRLEYFDAKGNKLTKLPDSFGGLAQLEYLCIKYNNISYFPPSISLLSRLRHCDADKTTYLPASFVCLEDNACTGKYQNYCNICGKNYQKISVSAVKLHISIHK